MTGSEPTVPLLRPLVVHHDDHAARISLVPDGALLLADDAIEIDVTVDAGGRLDLVEPGGTVAFDMRGRRARWDVRIRLGTDAALTWAGEPFVVAAGADVRRRLDVRLATGATAALRETLVLGRYGEPPGRLRQESVVRQDQEPVLVEDLPLDATTVAGLLGGQRIMTSVLLVGRSAPDACPTARYDLDAGGHLWRRLGIQAHETELNTAWAAAVRTVA